MKTIDARRWIMPSKREVLLENFAFASDPGPREVVVRTLWTAVSPGTECSNYLALDPNTLRPGTWCSYPWVPGYTGVGEIIALGADVQNYKVGDMVVGRMQHASHNVLNTDFLCAPAVAGLSPDHAAHGLILNIAFTALQVLRKETFGVAGVWGLGMIGNLVAQVLKQAGYEVVGVDPVESRRVLAGRCGITRTLDPSSERFFDEIDALTAGRRLDVAVDTTGHAPTTVRIPECIRRCGEMVLMTHWRSQPSIDASPLIQHVFEKGITLRGAHESAPGAAPFEDWAALQRHKLAAGQRKMLQGDISIDPLISHRVKPAQCKDTYEGLCFDKSTWWGVAVDWQG